jgi:hypothetical protein
MASAIYVCFTVCLHSVQIRSKYAKKYVGSADLTERFVQGEM